MSTSAFKSTTKRTPIGKSPATVEDTPSSSISSSSSFHRRSGSLSRFSRHRPKDFSDDFSDDYSAHPPPQSLRKAKFVNNLRGQQEAFPEITLDDLAISFFSSGDRRSMRSDARERTPVASQARGRSVSRHSIGGGGQSGRTENSDGSSRRSDGGERSVAASQCRGRSVSRHSNDGVGSGGGGGCNHNAGSRNSDVSSRRRRSFSVAPYQITDSEGDHSVDLSPGRLQNLDRGSSKVLLSDTTAAATHKQGLRRSLSQKDLKHHDGYSSHSSALTDDDSKYAHLSRNGTERTIRTVYSQKKAEHPTGEDIDGGGLYEAMRKEIRHAVEEIKMELAMGKTNATSLESDWLPKSSDVLQAVSTIRSNYAAELEKSEKRKQDLLGEILMEERCGRELSKIVKDLLGETNNDAIKKPSRTRKRSNDRSRMSTCLTEEAKRYTEDFIPNVEDTDISSLDGERSDTSSTLGGTKSPETFQSPPAPVTKLRPVETDGVLLPWLQWETSNDASPLHCKNKKSTTLQTPISTPTTKLWDTHQEESPTQVMGSLSTSSCGNWSRGSVNKYSTNSAEVIINPYREIKSNVSQISSERPRSHIDVNEYLNRQSDEHLLIERWRQQQSIHSGRLVLCDRMCF